MGQIKQIITADEAKFLSAHRRMVDAQAKVEAAGGKIVKKSKEQDEGIAKLGANAVGRFKNMVTSMIGVGGVTAALGMIKAEVEAVDTAMANMAERSKALDDAAQAVANQMGKASTDAGLQVGEQTLAEMMKAGRFGGDWERGKSAAIAAHVAYGQPGQALTGEALEIAKLGAGFAGYKQIGAEETGGLFKILEQAGARGQGQVARRLRQFGLAYEQALSVDPSANIGGITRFMGDYIAQGGGFEAGMAEFGRAVQVSGSEEEAAQLVRKMGQIMYGEKMTEAIGGARGISADAVRGMGYDQRRAAMREYLNEYGVDETALAGAGVTPRQIGWVKKMYGGEGLGDIAGRQKYLQSATAEDLYGELGEFAGTSRAAILEQRTVNALKSRETMEATKYGTEILEWGRLEVEDMRQRGMGRRDWFWMTGKQEAQQEARWHYQRRLRALKGKVSPEDYAAAEGEVQDMFGGRGLGIEIGVPGFSLANAKEVGEAAFAVEALERAAAAIERAAGKLERGADAVKPRLDAN